MIGEFFKALLITSLAGSVLAVVISLLRPITKKLFGYSWHYYIWLCVLFVMLMLIQRLRRTLQRKWYRHSKQLPVNNPKQPRILCRQPLLKSRSFCRKQRLYGIG